jgi:hypothetical protein
MKLPTWFLSTVTGALLLSAGWMVSTLIDVKERLARIEFQIKKLP